MPGTQSDIYMPYAEKLSRPVLIGAVWERNSRDPPTEGNLLKLVIVGPRRNPNNKYAEEIEVIALDGQRLTITLTSLQFYWSPI